MLSGSMMGSGYEVPLLGAVVASALVPSDLLQLPAIFLGAMLAQECTDYYRTHAQEWEKGFRAKQIRSAHTLMSLVENHGLTGFLPPSYNTVPDGFPRARTKWELTFGLSINPAEAETLYNPYFIPANGLINSLYTETCNVHDIPQSLLDAYRCFRKIATTGEYENSRRVGFMFLRIIDEIIHQLNTDASFTYMHVAEAMRRVHMLLNETLRDYGDVVLFENATTQFLMTGHDPSVTRTITRNNFEVPEGFSSPLSLVKAAMTESMERFISTDIPRHIEDTSASMRKSAEDLLIAVAKEHGLINKKGLTSFTPAEIAGFTFQDSFKTHLYRKYLSRLENDRETLSVEEIAADFEENANTSERKEFARFLAAFYVVNRQINCQENIVGIIRISGSLSIPEMLPIFDESFFAFADQVPAIISNIIPVFDSENKKTRIKATSGDKFNEFKSRLQSIQRQVTILRSSSYQRARNDEDYLTELERKVTDVSDSFGSRLGEKRRALLESQVRKVRIRVLGNREEEVKEEAVSAPILEENLSGLIDPEHDSFSRAFNETAGGVREWMQTHYFGPDHINEAAVFWNARTNWRARMLANDTDEARAVVEAFDHQVDTLKAGFERVMNQFETAIKTATPQSLSYEPLRPEEVPSAHLRGNIATGARCLNRAFEDYVRFLNIQLSRDCQRIRDIATAHQDYLRSKRDYQDSLDNVLFDSYGQEQDLLSEGITQSMDATRPKFENIRHAFENMNFIMELPDVEVTLRETGHATLQQTDFSSPSARLSWFRNNSDDRNPLVRQNQATVDFIYTLVNRMAGWDEAAKQTFLRRMLSGSEFDVTSRLIAFRAALEQQNTSVWLMSCKLWTAGSLMMRLFDVKLPLNLLVPDTAAVTVSATTEQRALLAVMHSSDSNVINRQAYFGKKRYGLFVDESYRRLHIDNIKQADHWSEDQRQKLGLAPMAVAG